MDERQIMKKISVLMIGNSFSVDVAHFTHQLSLNSDTEIEVCVLYVGGCSLEQHVNFIKEGSTPYEWFINGVSTGRYISLKDALLMKEYDYISLQQVSVFSGLKDTFYPYIKELVDYVKDYQKSHTLYSIKHGHIKQALITLTLLTITTIEKQCMRASIKHTTTSKGT